ncbi:MAG TPA: transcription termination factor Rho [Acidimicrobiia bacterium]|nr:transcription termination factor Rho [Acidimicrobiia bacterium]
MAQENKLERSMLDGKDREELHAIAGAIGVKGVSRLKKADLVDAILTASGNSSAAGADAAVANAGNGDKPKRVRSRKASQVAEDDPIAALAAEEASLEGSSDDGGAGPEVSPRPVRRSRATPATEAPATELAAEAVGSSDSAVTTARSDGGADKAGRDNAGRDGGRRGGRDGGGRDNAGRKGGGGNAGRDGGGRDNAGRDGGGNAGGGNAGGGRRGGKGGANRADTDDQRASFGEGNRSRRRRRGRGRDRQGEANEPSAEFTGEPVDVEGLLDLRDEGYGFLRSGGYLPADNDAYVSASQVRRFALRKGDLVKGATRPAASNEKYPALLRVDQINGMTPDEARERPRFEDLTALFPDSKLRLELTDEPMNITGRIIDLLSPVGKGQRGLVVSPPKAGKTTILKELVYAIERNNPEVHLMVLLVDERPEEVTDMRRHVLRGEVVASTFDRPSDEHTQVAELSIDRAKRLVEMGTDVVIVLDGITRLARAYNLAAPASGRILSGGVDSTALYPPKRFFGAARNIEEGGSLTIIATALIETGSRMDEVIFEEFKGTGNMELRLDRRLSERRIYPSIDVEASSTRHEELLFERDQLQQVWKLRRVLNALEGGAGLELLIEKLRTTATNDEFLAEIAKAPAPGG